MIRAILKLGLLFVAGRTFISKLEALITHMRHGNNVNCHS